MLQFNEAVNIFKNLQKKAGIPEDANFQFAEKRNIEMYPNEPGSSLGPIKPNTTQVVKNETLAGNDSQDSQIISEIVVWVGYFSKGPFFWEFAINMNGALIRLRKSR
jgi:hypothetical protein